MNKKKNDILKTVIYDEYHILLDYRRELDYYIKRRIRSQKYINLHFNYFLKMIEQNINLETSKILANIMYPLSCR